MYELCTHPINLLFLHLLHLRVRGLLYGLRLDGEPCDRARKELLDSTRSFCRAYQTFQTVNTSEKADKYQVVKSYGKRHEKLLNKGHKRQKEALKSLLSSTNYAL